MKKIEIDGRKFSLKERKEVTYGAYKEVDALKEDATLALMPNKLIAEMWLAKNTGNEKEEVTVEGLMAKLAEGDMRETLSALRKAALSPEVEAIMLSVGLTRDEIHELPVDMVNKLAKAADDALGGLANFTNASTINST